MSQVHIKDEKHMKNEEKKENSLRSVHPMHAKGD